MARKKKISLYELFIMFLKRYLKRSHQAVEEELIDSSDMQRLLKCSESTLQRLRKKGAIPCNKIGGRYYYPKNFFTQEFLKSITKGDDPSKRFDDL